MTCSSCTSAVKDALTSIRGVLAASVSLHSLSARVVYDAKQTGHSAFLRAIEDAGFAATVSNPEEDWKAPWVAAAATRKSSISKDLRAFRASAIVSGLTFGMQMATRWTEIDALGIRGVLEFLELCAATICVAILGAPIHCEAYRALISRQVSSSVLSSIGLIAVYAAALQRSLMTSGYGSGSGIEGYSLTSASMLLTVILGGRVTKTLVTDSSSELPTALATIIPKTSRILLPGRKAQLEGQVVPTTLLQAGDMIVIGADAVFPADCIVVNGTTTILETITKGETIPTPVGAGDMVHAGCTNREQEVIAEVVRTGRHSWLGQTLQAFERAHDTKSSSALSHERILAVFSILVLAFAISTAIVYFVRGAPVGMLLTRLATVTLCACPCSLGLGVPVCLMACSLNAYNSRILLRPSERIGQVAGTRCIVFDKTGTLTQATLRVCSEEFDAEWYSKPARRALLWQMVDQLTGVSSHPVSILLQQLSKRRLAEQFIEIRTNSPIMTSYEVHPGLGQEAVFTVCGKSMRLTIGNYRMMQQNNVHFTTERNATSYPINHGTSLVFIAVDGEYVGTVQYSDTIVPAARAFVQALHDSGMTIYIMTGDTRTSAQAIGRQVGITDKCIFAGLLPHEKAAQVTELEQKHGPVVMVGDNLNDAAALASASLGIVISYGSDSDDEKHSDAVRMSLLPLLQAGADVYVLPPRKNRRSERNVRKAIAQPSDLSRVTYVLDLVAETDRRIRRVMRWSMAYNVVSLTLASGIVNAIAPDMAPAWLDLSPTTASLLMSLSSLLTLQYALQLSNWHPSRPEIANDS